MNKAPCKGCVPPKRYLGCHDGCPEYQKSKSQYNTWKPDEAANYLFDKHLRLKKEYGGRR